MGIPSRLFVGSIKTTVRRLAGIRRPHVLVACMPKSASTYLSNVITQLPNMRRTQLTWAYGRREQTLDPIQLARYDLSSYVCQQHLRYSSDVGKLIKEFGLTPVVLTRDLFDIVPSIRDHLRNEDHESPMATVGPEHAALPDAALEELIADLMIPWYLNFYVSWLGVDCVRTTYDEVRQQPADVTARICAAAGMNVDGETIARAVVAAGGKNNRLNKGTPGRGAAISEVARERIISLTRHYPGVDFSPIGLPTRT